MTIAILSALAEEQHGLVDAMEGMQGQRHAGRDFWLGRLHGHEVVCALSGIGKVAAATTTAALIERFGVRAIVFTGVAGGVGEDVHVGDVVIARDYLQHDIDASPLFPRWEVPGYGRARMDCDAALNALLLEAARAYLADAGAHFVADLPNAARAPQVHHGLMASGDRFVSTAQESSALRAALLASDHDVLAVEMEGAAVAQVCRDYGLPFAAVRTISDRADDSAHVDFAHFMQNVASRYADHIVQRFVQML